MAKQATKKTEIELPKAGQAVRVKAQRDGYRRAGIAHTREPVDHPHDAFTPEQLEALHADENIIVSYIDKPKAGA